ncbi:uncharacterized protein LOC101731022 isoform X4 [Xenopus tropicalis]|uniref:Uncharacterized protein LOC101731022 isoform X4 n=1 Tax=Xenopus tropicalis TaxID=8364 RepID=A0A8J1J4M0_XENTR|nr:uncharacterized protein LOC101731022 isoform X4 [Xenopus tropicalis]
MVWNTQEGRIFLPPEKRLKIRDRVHKFQNRKFSSIKQGLEILGLFSAVLEAVPWGRAHMKDLQRYINSVWDHQKASLRRKLYVPPEIKKSLNWWLHPRNLSKGSALFPVPPLVITTDASGKGWGAHLGNLVEQGSWEKGIAHQAANSLELEAVWRALLAFKTIVKDQNVLIHTDNVATAYYINHQGGSRSKDLGMRVKKIMCWGEKNLKSILARHISGHSNIRADFLSRRLILPGEWSLDPETFLQICKVWGSPVIDLMASKYNAKHQRFFSLTAGQGEEAVDALAQSWDFSLAYIFPPIPMLARVIKKVALCSTEVILIAPAWPRRSWYSSLLQLSVSPPWPLPVKENLLHQGPIFHPNPAALQLTAWRLKGML